MNEPEKPQAKGDSGVSIYLCKPETAQDGELLQNYRNLLDEEERLRMARFRFAEDKHVFLVSHALARTALSQDAGIAPEAWRFQTNKFGRPEISAPALAATLRFSLTHTRGLAACAVVEAADIGIDVEAVPTGTDVLELASHNFAPTEFNALQSAPAAGRNDLFTKFWTLKESYIKARGVGLSLPLDKFAFEIKKDAIEVHFDPELDENARDWHFALWKPAPQYYMALALSLSAVRAHAISVKWFLPLRGELTDQPAPVLIAASGDR